MKKDILNKLELKNFENLSSNRMDDSVYRMNRDLDHLKINDDFSNEELIEDEFNIVENNSYIELKDVDNFGGVKVEDEGKVDISALPLDNK